MTLLIASALADAATAEIRFLPAPAYPVSEGPRYLGFGDFDGDGVADIVVTSTAVNELSVLTASPTGVLARRGEPIRIGRNLRQLAVQDFTRDGLTDFMVINQSGGAKASDVQLFPRIGDGLFGSPVTITLPDRRAEAIVSADFDRIDGPDFMVSHGRTGSVTAFFHNADDDGFTALPSIEVATEPRLMVTGQFNHDNLPDVAILNTAPTDNDEIVVLVGGSGPSFSTASQVSLSGEPVVALVSTDLDGDSLADLVMVHEQADRHYAITALLNQTGTQPGAFLSFRKIGPRNFECPRIGSDSPTRCEPMDIAAADFDHDGNLDLALSMTVPSGIAFLTSSGAGEFVASTFLAVGKEPTDLAVADVTGDRQLDLVVADFGNDSIVVLVNGAPPQSPIGAPCSDGSQCLSGECVDEVCCSQASCPNGLRCNVTGSAGFCTTPGALGTKCSVGGSCGSGFCVDGTCCQSSSCSSGQRCDVVGAGGVCRVPPPTATATGTSTVTPTRTPTPSPQPNGRDCGDAAQCSSGACVDGVCCVDATCGEERYCNISASRGSCAPRRFAGETCGVAGDCLSGVCARGLCVGGAQGTATATRTSTPTATPTGLPLGDSCTAGGAAVCASRLCTHGVCCAEGSCAVGERCDVFGEKGECVPQLAAGAACEKASDCRDGRACEPGPDQTPRCSSTPGATPGPEACVGDCDGSNDVTVDELLTMIDIALGQQNIANCEAGDNDASGDISVDEILRAVTLALVGCAPLPTNTPGPSPTPSPTTPRPPTATPTEPLPTATMPEPTATFTEVPPTSTPTLPPPTPTFTLAPPTPTPTQRIVDLSHFQEFQFDRFGSGGFCPPIGAVYSVTLRRAGSDINLELSYLVEGNPQSDSCLPDYTGPATCPVATALAGETMALTAGERDQVTAAFSAVHMQGSTDPSCSATPCLINVARWDVIEANDFECEHGNRLPAAQSQAIQDLLNGLLATRLGG